VLKKAGTERRQPIIDGVPGGLNLVPHKKADFFRETPIRSLKHDDRAITELTTWAGKRVTASPRWPKSPLAFSRELRRIAPQMRMHGVSIMLLKIREKRFIEVISTKPPIPEEPHVSVGGMKRYSDELIDGDPDAAQMAATA